jgi:uncharacterized membrane protein YcaP (DUF421 family)
VSDGRSVINALLAISTIALMYIFVAWLKNWSEAFRKFVEGTPIVVVEEGRVNRELLGRLRMQEEDLMAAARQDGLERLDQVVFAVVERNGGISSVRKHE